MLFHSVTHLSLLWSVLGISFQRWFLLLVGWRGDGPYFLEALHLPGREAGPARRWLPVCLSLRLLAVLFPGLLRVSMCPSDQCPDRPWWLQARSSTVFCLPLLFPGCPSSPLAPCWMKTAEPRTQCWRDTLPDDRQRSCSSSSSSKPGAEGNSSSTGSFSWVRT